SSPAQRPTWLSNPSAPITIGARTSNVSAICSHRAPTTRPSSRSSPTALVLIRISARLRGFLREIAVEQGPLEDVAALVPGPGFVHDQRASIGREPAGAVDLVADELLRRREADFLQPSLRDALPASDRGPDFRALLDKEDVGAPLGHVLRGRTAGRPRSDDEHVDLLVHDIVRISAGLMSLLGVWTPPRVVVGFVRLTLG